MPKAPLFRFYRRRSFPIPIELWHRLPRLTTHKNVYWDGAAQPSPRPQTCGGELALNGWAPPSPPAGDVDWPHRPSIAIRRLAEPDWADLPALFHLALGRLQPLSSWNRFAAARASRAILTWTRLGRDGPLVDDACFAARGRLRSGEPATVCAAAIVVWQPAGGRAWQAAHGDGGVPRPTDPARRVVPHLNWMFVHPEFQGPGVARAGGLRHALIAVGWAADGPVGCGPRWVR